MAASTNSYYGHAAILNRYARVSSGRPRPIFGYLQHGWYHGWSEWMNLESEYTRLPDSIPKLMWADADVEALDAAGAGSAEAIGSPFLYLLEMRGFAPRPGDGSLLCFPFHSIPNGSHDMSWAGYADEIRDLAGGRRVTICLHAHDFTDPSSEPLRRASDLTVTSNGDKADPMFLDRLAELMEGHDEVVSNRLGTALVYAAAMGRRVSLHGRVPAVTTAGGRVYTREDELMETFQQERFPELIEGLDPRSAREWGERELGARRMLPPDQLATTLGWRGARRSKAIALRFAAATRRLLTGDG